LKGLNDRSLVSLCIEKDASAWSSFVDRFSNLIYWAIKDRLKRYNFQFVEQDVEDIYQELFVSLWEKNGLTEIKDRAKISSWLVMVAGNEAIDHFRKKKNEGPRISASIFQSVSSDVGEAAEELMLTGTLSSSEDDPSRIVYLKELDRILEATIETLPPRERQAITLSFLYGKKHREIAQLLKISINTASTIIRRVRAKLRKELKKKGIKDF